MTARRETTKERAFGQWKFILPRIGIDARFLTGKNCACPMCGGRDRFRFIDRNGRDGDGMWVCNQCAPSPRPSMDLVIAFTGKPFREAARLVDDILGVTPPPPRPAQERAARVATPSTHPARVWKRGVPVRRGDAVDCYLRSRGVGLDIYPPVLRCSALDWHKDDDTGALTRWPAMFALVHGFAGKPVAVHRTFLAMDGSGKAPVSTPRKATGGYGSSPTIRLTPPGLVMGIAEGVETALAASRLFNIPTWSVICANGIRNFEPLPECRQLVVFADHDKNGTGQLAAAELAKRLCDRVTVEIKLPEREGNDWNDVLMGRAR